MQRLFIPIGLLYSIIFFVLSSTTKAQGPLELQLQKGISAFEKGQFPKAERIFDKLIASEESYAEVYIWKSKCLQEFEEYQAAYNALQTACNLAPMHAPYWVEMGKFKYLLGINSIQKPESCGECGKLILPLANGNINSTNYYQSAVKDYQKAIKLAPNHAEAYYQLALSYQALGHLEQACLQLQKAQSFQHAQAHQYSTEICP